MKGNTMIETTEFARKPFTVQAVQVKADNIADVAEWCGGEVRTNNKKNGDTEQYVHVDVHRPQSERHSKAFLNDWVLFNGTGYKVYPNRAFRKNFEETGLTTMDPGQPSPTPVTVPEPSVEGTDDGGVSTLS